MQGMFRANGGCGFVKKPDFLLKTGPHDEVFDPKVKFPVKKTLKVRALLLGFLTLFSFLKHLTEVLLFILFIFVSTKGYSSLVI